MRIHVDVGPEHEPTTFEETNGEPILCYQGGEWVLFYIEDGGNGVDDYVTGVYDRSDIDAAVSRAAAWLRVVRANANLHSTSGRN